MKAGAVISHLVSAKCVPMGFAVDQASIFSLLPLNFSHADTNENLHEKLSDMTTLVNCDFKPKILITCYCKINDLIIIYL